MLREAHSSPSTRSLCCSNFQILNHFLHPRGCLSLSGVGNVQLSAIAAPFECCPGWAAVCGDVSFNAAATSLGTAGLFVMGNIICRIYWGRLGATSPHAQPQLWIHPMVIPPFGVPLFGETDAALGFVVSVGGMGKGRECPQRGGSAWQHAGCLK